MRRIIVSIALTCLTSMIGSAQDDDKPLDFSLPAPDWKTGILKGRIPGWLYVADEDVPEGRWSTSSLKAYPDGNISDGNTATTWAEGMPGPGIGEIVVVQYNPIDQKPTPLWIWAGYGKSQELFLANNRPKNIKVHLLGTFCHDCTPRVCMLGNFDVVGTTEQTLKDINAFQPLTVPVLAIKDNTADCDIGGHDNDADHYLYKIAIEIISVYTGSKYDDTCISEIMDDYGYQRRLKKSLMKK